LSLRKFARLAGVVAALFPFATCADVTGPSGRGVQIPVVPTFSPAANFARALYASVGLEFDRVRVIVTRNDVTLKDTTVSFSPTSPELALPLVIAAVPGEVVKATLQYATATLVLYEGSSSVTTIAVGATQTTPPTPVVLVPVGPGATASTVEITPASGTFPVTGPASFSAKAFANDGIAIANPIFGWTVDDATVAAVNAQGVVQPTSKGGAVKVRATTLNGKFAEATVTFVTAPASIVVASGGDQTAMAYEPLGSDVVVKVLDANGNGVPGATVAFAVTAGGGSVRTVNETSDPSGLVAAKWTLGELVGTQSVTATATALPDKPLKFNATATERPAKKLAFAQQPTKSLMGASIMPAITVKAFDDHDRVVTGFTGPITLAFETNPKGAALGGPLTANAVAGVATFENVTVSAAGEGYSLKAGSPDLTTAISSTFNVEQVPSGLSLVSGGSQTAAKRSKLSQVAVKVADANGIGVPKVKVTFEIVTGKGTLTIDNDTTDANGVARATWTLGDSLGTQSMRATSGTLTGSPLTITATATPLPAIGLAFSQGPSNVQVGVVMAPAVTVKAVDADGNTVAAFTSNVELTLQNNPNGATLGGARIVAAVNGVAAFPDLTVSAPGSGYALKATSGTLASVTSATFVVSPPPATALKFQVQPSNTVTGSKITPAITVRIVDAGGNTVPGATNQVSLSKAVALADYGISGTLTVNAVNGIATFSNVTVVGPGNGYTLKAQASGLTEDVSAAFNVTTPAAPSRVWNGSVSADWNVAGNWTPAAVPASGDSVTISAGANQPVITTAAAASVIVIGTGMTLRVNALDLTVDVPKVINEGTLWLTWGYVNGSIDNRSLFFVDGFGGANDLVNATGATARVAGNSNNEDGGVLVMSHAITNDGTLAITHVNGGFSAVVAGDSIVNHGGATITVPSGAGDSDIEGVLRNYGQINVAGSGYFLIASNKTGSLNAGSITLTGGGELAHVLYDSTQTFENSFVNTGTISLGTSNWEFFNGHLDLRAGTLTGTGILYAYASKLDIDWTRMPLRLSTVAETRFAGDSLLIPAGATAQFQNSTIAQNVTVLGTMKTLKDQNGSQVNFDGNLSIKSGGVFEAQTSGGAQGSLSTASTGTFRLVARDDDTFFCVQSSAANAGTIELTSTTNSRTAICMTGTDPFTNTGTIKAQTGGGGERWIQGILHNQGNISVDADARFSLYTGSTANTNSGTITLADATPPASPTSNNLESFGLRQVATGGLITNTGTISIGANRGFYIGSAMTLANGAAGLVEGNGTLRVSAGTFTNTGALAPGGRNALGKLTVEGNWNGAGGALELDIKGTTAGQFDQLQVTGTATPAGVLRLTYLNGFTPGCCSALPVIPAPSYGANTVTFDPAQWGSYIDGGFHIFYNGGAALKAKGPPAGRPPTPPGPPR
jgi:hypothetical protein